MVWRRAQLDNSRVSNHGAIVKSIRHCSRCGGIVDKYPSATCFLLSDAAAVSGGVTTSGHFAEEPTSSKWPRNLGGKPRPRRQSLAKSWLKAGDLRGWVPWTFCNAGRVTRRADQSRSQTPVGAGAAWGNWESWGGKLGQIEEWWWNLLLWQWHNNNIRAI